MLNILKIYFAVKNNINYLHRRNPHLPWHFLLDIKYVFGPLTPITLIREQTETGFEWQFYHVLEVNGFIWSLEQNFLSPMRH